MSLPTNPINRKEAYLNAIATGNTADMPATPITREEAYLDYIAKNGGGGSGEGDMKKSVYDSDLAVANAGGIGAFVGDAILGKVDKVEGKGLSTNDYDNTEKGKVADNASAIEAITDVYGAKNLLPFDLNTLKSLNTTGTWNGNVYTLSGVSFSVVTGNKGEVLRIELSGTSSADITFSIADNYSLSNGTFIMNGITTNGLAKIGNSINGAAYDYYTKDDTDGKEYTFASSDVIYTRIIIDNGTVFASTETVKPMLRDARITDPTYVPYAMTNKQLTDAVNEILTPGRDLTVVFADEIANYSDEWAWIQARLNAHNVSGLRVGDYIPIKVGAENHLAEIAGINTYRRTGDSGHEVGYHIDWITRDCYSGTVKFNTTNINNGNASNSSPFLASNLKSWLDGTLYPLLDAKLKAVIKAKRILAPYRYQSGATLTDDNSWGWQDFDKLWVPLEGEIFDSLVWSTKGYGNGQAVQYPIFANSYEHRMKGAGPGGARAIWWTASALSGYSASVVNVTDHGSSDHSGASAAGCVPVCFRTMEA